MFLQGENTDTDRVAASSSHHRPKIMLNNKMDDLDHSMRIADHDWKSFFEETEECWLLQPLLACPDNWSLSDSEDSGNFSASVGADPAELCQNEGGQSDAVRCCAEGGREQENLEAKEKGEGSGLAEAATCCHVTAPCAEVVEHVLQVTSAPGTQRAEQQNAPSPVGEVAELQKGEMQKEGNLLSLEEPDPLSSKPRELSAGRDVTSGTGKERWFITVSDNPLRQQVRTKAAKTKTRQKTTCRKENKPRSRPKKKARESGREAQSDGISAGHPGSGSLSPALDNMLTTDVDFQDPSGTLPSAGPSKLDSKAGDGLEFVSAHSWDSDSYLSAEEEYQEARHAPSSAALRKKPTLDSIVYPAGETVPRTCGGTDAALARPSAKKGSNECFDHNDGEGSAESPGRQAHGFIHPPASVGIPGDQCGRPDVPDVTLTPCTVADSPETYAAAAGHHRPVYAISSFWDEMEKLTINDILQLRMGRGSPPAGSDEAATPHVDDLAESHGDPAELAVPGAGLMDGSDNADSDYFTQLDDSKPDRSSCEFSASDFEEEYWQFLGTSRNPSPDPQTGKICKSPCTARDEEEEEESTGSEGRDTPVPPDSPADWPSEHQEALTPDNPPDHRPILKSKSFRNIQALNTSDLCLDSKDESRLFLFSCLSPDGEKLGGAIESMETEILSLSMPDTTAEKDRTQLYVLDLSECYYTKDAETHGRSVIVYNPEDILPVSALHQSFLYTLCCSDFMKEKPLPIFSYSHSTIRELTFPSYISLSADPLLPLLTHLGDMADIVRGPSSEAPQWFHNWNGLQPVRTMPFHSKGIIWWKGSGVRLFPVEDRELCTDRADLQIPDPKRISTTGPQTCSDLAVQQRLSDPVKMRRDDFFSKLRQSDMCLVCIAFASWVLRSSDPDAADTWKAALLANVSALSAIQYLRQYVRRKPSQDNP